jgi:uncharacterized protein
MATYLTPGIYIEEKKSAVQPIEAASTSVAAFIGVTQKGPVNKATLITSLAEFGNIFGNPLPIVLGSQEHYLAHSVRHFFMEGGTKCYVVRVTGYEDITNPVSQALAATAKINGLDLAGAAVANTLEVSASSPGKWGESLAVRVENASRFSVLLAEPTVASATQLTVKDNQDIQVGSLLFVVDQLTATVQKVVGNLVTVLPGHTAEPPGLLTSVTLPSGAFVFTPDMKLGTTTTAAATFDYAAAGVVLTLSTVTKVNGDKLKIGDVINIPRPLAGFPKGITPQVVVKRFVEKTVAGERAMLVELESALPATPVFPTASTKLYARDFDLIVGEDKIERERHEHLSLIATNKRDYVNERLAPDSGASRLISAKELAAAGTTVVDVAFNANVPFPVALTSGDDGLTAFADNHIVGNEASATGLFALDTLKEASILVIPNASAAVAQQAMAYCAKRKDLFLILDTPRTATEPLTHAGNVGSSDYAALYFPWITDSDPVTGKPIALPPSGAVAGTFAYTDVARGVHKAPAGVNEGYLNSATGVQLVVTKGQNDIYYQGKVNVIRKYPEGILVWGARTLSASPEWRYVNVRRLFIFLEQSIERGLGWVVFEPNDYPLWKSIQRNVGSFLRVQWEEGKLVGTTEAKAFFVRCDQTTNPPDTVNAGQVIAEVGVAPSKPAEFVVFRFKQFVGKTN